MFSKKGWGWDKKAAYTFAKGHGGYYSANHVYWQENWLSASRYDVDMHQVFLCLQQGLFLRLEFQVANYTAKLKLILLSSKLVLPRSNEKSLNSLNLALNPNSVSLISWESVSSVSSNLHSF